jgi:predicted nucleic acid-binding Zn ribbon protein
LSRIIFILFEKIFFKEIFMPIFEYRCSECGKKIEELVTGDRDQIIPAHHVVQEHRKTMSAIGGISMGKSPSGMPSCGSSCCSGPGSAPTCASGMCPHAG